MRFFASCNFDAGKGAVKKGEPYSGSDAEELLKKGLLLPLEEAPRPEEEAEPQIFSDMEVEVPLEAEPAIYASPEEPEPQADAPKKRGRPRKAG